MNTAWFEKLPPSWTAVRLKYASPLVDHKVSSVGSTLPYLGLENIESWTARKVENVEAQNAEGTANLFWAGDVLFGKLRPYLAKVYQAQHQGIASTEFLVLRPAKATARFLKYALLSPAFIDLVNASTYGVRMPRTSWEVIGDIALPVPSITEQERICDFLDQKTAMDDALIANLNNFSRLLDERRLLLIAQAVTKGLKLREPTKKTGERWAEEIPSHWSIRKLSQVAQLIGSGTTPPADEPIWYDGPVPFLTTTELRETTVLETARTVTLAALRRFSSLRTYPAGSVVIAMYGATIGRLGILGIPSTVNQACCVIQGSDILSGDYLYYWLMAMRQELVRLASGGGQPNISQGIIRSLRVPLPPIDEQREIVTYLKELDAQTVSALEDARSALRLARQRRSALITAAVTGQIQSMKHASDGATAKEVA